MGENIHNKRMKIDSKSVNNKQVYKERTAARVTILDAVDLDSEIHRILRDQLLKICYAFSPTFVRWEPELDTLLRIVLWKLSVWQLRATFGQQLLSVRYGREFTPRRAAVWGGLSIGAQYIKLRSSQITTLVQPTSEEKVRRVMDWLELGVQISSLVNLLVFLREGEYPTLADRLTGLRPVSATTTSRVVGYSYMTRELLWHGFIELIVFILPLVNYKYLLRCLRKGFGLQRSRSAAVTEPLVYTCATRCAVCNDPPVLPHHMGCHHTFCYYCLLSNLMADSKFECPSCGHHSLDQSSVQPVSSSPSVQV